MLLHLFSRSMVICQNTFESFPARILATCYPLSDSIATYIRNNGLDQSASVYYFSLLVHISIGNLRLQRPPFEEHFMAEFSDLIVVIPGFFGSRLERPIGTLLYDLTLAGLPKTLRTLTGDGLSHMSQDGPPNDDVVATDLFNYQLLPGFFGNDDYDALIKMLQGCVTYPDQQVIKFPYDWRASNRWAAERLNDMSQNRLKEWKAFSGNKDAKLWLVCHSMGGLIARYFCEHLGGAEITRELITISTPHRGAAQALAVLVNGMRLAGLINVTQFVRSLPSVYELLPQYPVLYEWGGGDGAAFRLPDIYGLGDRLAIPKQARAQAAHGLIPDGLKGFFQRDQTMVQMVQRGVDFHAAIRDPVLKRMDEGVPPPYRTRCFLNRRQPTVLSALWDNGRMEPSKSDPLAATSGVADPSNRGDGTVPAFAAIPIEWDDTSAAVAVSAKHVGMPASEIVHTVLYNWIHPQDARAYMGGGIEDREVLALDVPSMIQQGEELVIKVDALVPANVTVTAELVNKNISLKPIRTRVAGSGEPQVIGLGLPGEGTWRVTVVPEDPRRPAVSDYTVVLLPG